jgi:hypothetical protein
MSRAAVRSTPPPSLQVALEWLLNHVVACAVGAIRARVKLVIMLIFILTSGAGRFVFVVSGAQYIDIDALLNCGHARGADT